MKIASYPSDLTVAQWKTIESILPKLGKRGRPRTDRRIILNAILYVLRTGIQWRLLPNDFPNWKTVYHVFRQWSLKSTWKLIHDALRASVRKSLGRNPKATACILDSQSVKSADHSGPVGYDAAKKIKGRKRHLLVDTEGLIIAASVTSADVPERKGAIDLLEKGLPWQRSLKKLWVDGGYSGEDFANAVKEISPKLETEVVKRSDNQEGFKVLPRRWVVERTFGWVMKQRRLARDYEVSLESALNWIYLAMIRIQVRRIA